MKVPSIGRNDPCPCGSGKKFKKCCLETRESVPSGGAAAKASADLRKAMEGMQFESLTDVQAFVGHHMQQRNQRSLDEFHGLSPEQMHRLLNFPFTSPELIRFPDGDTWRPHEFYKDSFLRAFPMLLDELPQPMNALFTNIG